MKAQQTPLKDAKVVFFGAGSSAVGVAMMIAQQLADDGGYKLDKALEVQPCILLAGYLYVHVIFGARITHICKAALASA